MSVLGSRNDAPFNFFQYRWAWGTFRFRLNQLKRLAWRRDQHFQVIRGMEQFSKRRRLLRLSVDQEDLAQVRRKRTNPVEQLPLVRVSAQLVQARDLGSHPHGFAENPHLRPLFYQLASQRILCLVAGDEHGIASVLDIVPQMVQNAALLAHSGCRNHDEGTMKVVQLLRIGGFPNVLKAPEPEGVLPAGQVLAGFVVEAFGVVAMDRGDVDGQGTIDEDRNTGNALLVGQLMEQERSERRVGKECRSR